MRTSLCILGSLCSCMHSSESVDVKRRRDRAYTSKNEIETKEETNKEDQDYKIKEIK